MNRNTAANIAIQLAGRREQLQALQAQLRDPTYSDDDKREIARRIRSMARLVVRLSREAKLAA